MTGLVLVTTSFPLQRDGSEAAGSFVDDLAQELARHGSVRVVAPGSDNRIEEWAPGVTVHRYAAPAKPLSTLRLWHPRELLQIAAVLRAGAAATAAAAAGPARHIVALWALPSGEWARRAARRRGIGYSVWTLGSDIWSLGRLPLLRQLLARVLRGARRCFSDGLLLAQDTREIGRCAVEFLPSTRRLDAQRVQPLRVAAPYRLLFLGRWHPNKGVDLLLQALALLTPADWDRIERVEIVGGGPLQEQVHAAVQQLRDAGRPLLVHGFLAKPEAEAALLRADFLLLPSRIESIPVVFSDAMKLRCPVVSMPVGDLPGLIPGCGVLAAEVTPQAFAAALRAALAQSPQDFADGMAAQAQRFDLAQVAARLRELV